MRLVVTAALITFTGKVLKFEPSCIKVLFCLVFAVFFNSD